MMSYTPSHYMKKTLLPDEHCIREAQFAWMYAVQAWLTGGFCAFFGYAIHDILQRYMQIYMLYPLWIGCGFGFWIFLIMMMKKWSTEIILTDERLIYKRGIFFVRVEEVDIEQLASDNVDQSLLGRIFDYGTISIRCVGANDILLPPIQRPYEFRNALEQQKHAYREQYIKVGHLRSGKQPEGH